MSSRLLTAFHFEWDRLPEEGGAKAISLLVTVASVDYTLFEERFYVLRGFDEPCIDPQATDVNGISTEMFDYYKLPVDAVAKDIESWLSSYASAGWNIAPICWDIEMIRRSLASLNLGDYSLSKDFLRIKNCGLSLNNFTDLQSIAKMLTMMHYPYAMVEDFARTMYFSKFYKMTMCDSTNIDQLEPVSIFPHHNNWWNVRHLGKYQIELMNNFLGVSNVQQQSMPFQG